MAHPDFSPSEDLPQVVIVDDEPALRRFMGACLQEHYRVLLAADGAEVLALFKGGAGPDISAVVTDIRMPGMDGLALAAALRDLGVGIPILFVSGYNVIGGTPGPVLGKPFLPDDLLSAVQTLLAAYHRPRLAQ